MRVRTEGTSMCIFNCHSDTCITDILIFKWVGAVDTVTDLIIKLAKTYLSYQGNKLVYK